MRIVAIAALAVATAVPATAVTYDAFASFNGAQGAGNFAYGYATDAYSDGTLFSASSNCFIDGSICLQQAANHDVPGVTKSTSTSFQYGSVNVPEDRLLLHPGNDGASNGTVFVAFIAPKSGYYNFSAVATVQDIRPSGVSIGTFVGFVNPFITTTELNAANPVFTYSGQIYLGQGFGFGLTFNRGTTNSNDSTGLNFTVNSVPEPATWALMITGLGLVGFAARRRRTVVAA